MTLFFGIFSGILLMRIKINKVQSDTHELIMKEIQVYNLIMDNTILHVNIFSFASLVWYDLYINLGGEL